MTAPPSDELAHAAMRGVIAAMAMTGMRTFTIHAGLVEEDPPQAIIGQRVRAMFGLVPRRRRRVVVELSHWAYGAAGGVGFRLLPGRLRLRPWAGPIYGLVLWLWFEAGLSPALRLEQARKARALERALLALDHALYGLVLSETRRQPRD